MWRVTQITERDESLAKICLHLTLVLIDESLLKYAFDDAYLRVGLGRHLSERVSPEEITLYLHGSRLSFLADTDSGESHVVEVTEPQDLGQ